jgi:hypothetical protein
MMLLRDEQQRLTGDPTDNGTGRSGRRLLERKARTRQSQGDPDMGMAERASEGIGSKQHTTKDARGTELEKERLKRWERKRRAKAMMISGGRRGVV